MTETLVIVAEGCPYCKALLEKLPKDEKIKILDVTKSLEAARIMQALQIYKVPLIVVAESDGEKTKYCVFENESRKIKCAEAQGEVESGK